MLPIARLVHHRSCDDAPRQNFNGSQSRPFSLGHGLGGRTKLALANLLARLHAARRETHHLLTLGF